MAYRSKSIEQNFVLQNSQSSLEKRMNQSINPAVTNPQAQPARGQRRPDSRWASVADLMAAEATVAVTVVDVANDRSGRPCGLHVTLQGLRAFLPGSHMPRHEGNVDLKGQTIAVKIIECDPQERGGKLVVSRLAAMKDERTRFIGSLTEGAEVRGQVVSVVDGLGYFVSLGAFDALLHRNETDGKVFTVGDSVTARISIVDMVKEKVSLTIRTPREQQKRFTGGDAAGSRQSGSSKTYETGSANVIAKSSAPARVPTAVKPVKPRSKSRSNKPKSPVVTFASFADLLAHMEQPITK